MAEGRVRRDERAARAGPQVALVDRVDRQETLGQPACGCLASEHAADLLDDLREPDRVEPDVGIHLALRQDIERWAVMAAQCVLERRLESTPT